jgi:hypothetical protein
MPNTNITQERAARRFHQMSVLEREIIIKSDEIATCREHLKELREAYDGLVMRLRTAARDEGELPLFSLEDE